MNKYESEKYKCGCYWCEREADPPPGDSEHVRTTPEFREANWYSDLQPVRPHDRGAETEPEMRQFDTGATRNREVDPDLYGFTSPLALGLFAQYMHEHRTQADGSIRESDNWKKGIPPDSYMRSMRRHLQDLTLHHDGYGVMAREDVVSAMAGLFFNVQGYMHEWVKENMIPEDQGGTE